MLSQENNPLEKSPILSVILTILIALIGFQILGPMLGLLLAAPFYDGSLVKLTEEIMQPIGKPELKIVIFIMQGFGAIFGLIFLPLVFLKIQPRSTTRLNSSKIFLQTLVVVPLIIISFLGVNSIFIEWNQNLTLPDFLSEVEKWARGVEDHLAEATKFLTTFNTFSEFAIAFVVIAVIASVGEELVFRGMIQRDLYRASKNIHLSIWISAAIFSAFHVQFFGFVPRMLLGALFGYLYHWSGNLFYPIIAHFVNNGLTITALYLYQLGKIDIDLESTEKIPWTAVAFSAALTSALLFYFQKFYKEHKPQDVSHEV